MTDLRKAAEMALEALERYGGVDQRACDAEEALRQALETEREWVGLTDEERNNLWRNIIGWGDPSHDDEDLMKAIESKLREKNT